MEDERLSYFKFLMLRLYLEKVFFFFNSFECRGSPFLYFLTPTEPASFRLCASGPITVVESPMLVGQGTASWSPQSGMSLNTSESRCPWQIVLWSVQVQYSLTFFEWKQKCTCKISSPARNHLKALALYQLYSASWCMCVKWDPLPILNQSTVPDSETM